MRVGVVDRLPSRLGDHDERERDGAERRAPASSTAGRRPCRRRCRAGRSCPLRALRPRARARAPPRRTPTASGRGSLPGARSRSRCPRPQRRPRTGRARAAPRAPERRDRRRARCADRRQGRAGSPRRARPRRAGGEPVDDRRALDVDALLPHSRRSSRYGCSGAGPRRPCRRALSLLGQAEQERRERDRRRRPERRRCGCGGAVIRSPRSGPRGAATTNEADQVRDVRSEPAALQAPRPASGEERAAR